MKLRIKIGNMDKDVREIFENPKKGRPGTHTLYLKNPKELYELLTPKRLELLMFTMQNKKEPITAISIALNRKQESISRDATILEKNGIIKKTKDKQKTYLQPIYTGFEITLQPQSN